ncbi:MAG: hypothetical protein HRU26_17335 [Psychroserpens sp.]|nr:hypothetical protein [Psychroserpens sp.]
MFSRSVFFILIILSLASCNTKESTEVKSEDEVIVKNEDVITKKEVQSLSYTEYGLSSDSQKIVIDWQKYQELVTQIDLLKKADVSFYKSEITLITTFLNEFRTEIPQSLSTNEIMARMTVLETKVLKLHSLLVLDNISKEEQIEGIREVLIAYSNLNLQINKKLEFEANNILKPTTQEE